MSQVSKWVKAREYTYEWPCPSWGYSHIGTVRVCAPRKPIIFGLENSTFSTCAARKDPPFQKYIGEYGVIWTIGEYGHKNWKYFLLMSFKGNRVRSGIYSSFPAINGHWWNPKGMVSCKYLSPFQEEWQVTCVQLSPGFLDLCTLQVTRTHSMFKYNDSSWWI